jgi:predicted RNA binding protein YcfA (HicA-like mRNA interferase family)
LAKLPRLTPQQAEKMLLKVGFEMVRSKGSHTIYKRKQKDDSSFSSWQNIAPKDS